jgi:hypothetical protein
MSIGTQIIDIGAQDLGFDLLLPDAAGDFRCPACQARSIYAAPCCAWVSHRIGKDLGFSWRSGFLVSQRFVDWVDQERIAGAILTQVGRDSYFLDAIQVEMHEERSGLVRQGALCPMCGLEANAIRPPVDGVARSLHVHWPFGEAKVLARTRQMVGSKPFPFPLFVCPSSLVASWKSFGLKLRRPDAAVAIPAEFRTAPASVVVHRSRPSVVPAGNPDSGDPLEPLRKVLGHPNPAFVCADSRGQHPASPIRIRNAAMPPATEADLKLGRAMLGKAASGLLKLFEVHNGVRLFEEPLRGEPGVRLAPIQEWEALTASCREGLPPTAPMDGFRASSRFVAFGEVPSAGAYLVVMTSGKQVGRVKLVMPVEWSASDFAESLSELVTQLCADPVSLFNQSLGCLIRYSDGVLRGTYFPEQYLEDAAFS